MANGIAVVTGAGTGIGAAVATAPATEGWLVVLAGRRSAPLHDLAAGHPDLLLDPVPTDATEEGLRAELRMRVTDVGRAIVYMAGLPLDSNVATMTVMATKMPYVGRG